MYAYLTYIDLTMNLLYKVKKPAAELPPALDPSDPFGDDERERQEVEALAKKFESKYVSIFHHHGYRPGDSRGFCPIRPPVKGGLCQAGMPGGDVPGSGFVMHLYSGFISL